MTNILKFKMLNMSGATTARCKRYKAAPLYRAEVSQSDFIALLARNAGASPATAGYYVAAAQELIKTLLQEGKRVHLDVATFAPALESATYDSIDADLSTARVTASVKATRGLKASIGEYLVAENVEKGWHLKIESVESAHMGKQNVIKPGVKVYMVCLGIWTETKNDDEGIFLESAEGKIVAKARIIEQYSDASVFVFDDDIPPGNRYRLFVSTRSGRSKEYAPVRQHYSKPITVLPR
jgi:hypothetical protein